MAVKSVMVPKEIVTCDCCGKEIPDGEKGEFSVTMHCNNASYREPGEDVVMFESWNKGDYCLTCIQSFINAFNEGMELVGLTERYEMKNLTVPEEVAWVKQWQNGGMSPLNRFVRLEHNLQECLSIVRRLNLSKDSPISPEQAKRISGGLQELQQALPKMIIDAKGKSS